MTQVECRLGSLLDIFANMFNRHGNRRVQGCLPGIAVSDALGTSLEFTLPDEFIPMNDIVGGGPSRLKPGQRTDDTSMAMCFATSLIEHSDWNLWIRCGVTCDSGVVGWAIESHSDALGQKVILCRR